MEQAMAQSVGGVDFENPIMVTLCGGATDPEAAWVEVIGAVDGTPGAWRVRMCSIRSLRLTPTYDDIIVVTPGPDGGLRWDGDTTDIDERGGRWTMRVDYWPNEGGDEQTVADQLSELARARDVVVGTRMANDEGGYRIFFAVPTPVHASSIMPDFEAVDAKVQHFDGESPELVWARAAYHAKRDKRIERLHTAAARARGASTAAYEKASGMAERIPLGQPILVGHHSEKRDRNYRDRIDKTFRKSFALNDEAKKLERRARSAETNHAISSDDPDAIEKLKAKLAQINAQRAKMVAANKAVRSKKPREALAKLGYSEAMITQLLTPDCLKRVGYADYQLSNAGAQARTIGKRIKELEDKASRPAPEPIVMSGGRIEEGENRVQIHFASRPNKETYRKLKSHGFRRAPSFGEDVWVQHASNGAWYDAKQILTLASSFVNEESKADG